ncbi:inositol-3-phosphate synthase INO1 KNAG_0C02520 [Huiozyma naganishii CBS 8797]|uniref:Inositol-3-phosphate synthase n=1 Tax=Huiozyma naganishii (strain ATCC MYA-139 / BCRC 22969 / CBS 8797 / KCTC 17520 / NBRC 10181 / NCYC 3082 / Yp74L-3) TaxID=1071383 RepID=J7RIL0_HUIN7|nr:hypothetical protein KNAG_0C02520 [Kazachstania naganishii CBS 8797]CCK69363.1 hypothetical protein KNAG_0C02520 [Kazachstania naganishii CBS 8797]
METVALFSVACKVAMCFEVAVYPRYINRSVWGVGRLLLRLSLPRSSSAPPHCTTMTNNSGSANAIPFNPQLCTLSRETNELVSSFKYQNTVIDTDPSTGAVRGLSPREINYNFKVDLSVPEKVGVLLVGFGGNNGSTLLASILANRQKMVFNNKEGPQRANFFGSMTQSSTMKLGVDVKGNDVFVPFNSVLPMADPTEFVVDGWDINNANLFEAMQRGHVLEYDLQMKLKSQMENIVPMKSVYYPDFIALNQFDRANNCINATQGGEGFSTAQKRKDLEQIRKDIRHFKATNKLDKVIVLWTANTERCVDIIPSVNDSADSLLKAIEDNHEEIAPSTIFAAASILEGVPYINGSPQNTFVPGLIDLAERHDVLIAGDDFKSGQTKLKSVLMQFLVDAGIKPVSIASYNHLGNNDGKNLSSQRQFRSKEISKSSVIDDCIQSNKILYNDHKDKSKVNHCIVIKYLPAVGDSKVAMDEYYSELMLGGHNRISIHNVCEDSLLAAPLIIDLLVMTEFFSRIKYQKIEDGAPPSDKFSDFYPILTFLSYWLKAPLTRKGFQPINSLNRQRLALENFLRLLIGLPPNDELRFEERLV